MMLSGLKQVSHPQAKRPGSGKETRVIELSDNGGRRADIVARVVYKAFYTQPAIFPVGIADTGVVGPVSIYRIVQPQSGVIRLSIISTVKDGQKLIVAPTDRDHVIQCACR